MMTQSPKEVGIDLDSTDVIYVVKQFGTQNRIGHYMPSGYIWRVFSFVLYGVGFYEAKAHVIYYGNMPEFKALNAGLG